jgi:hypothetical protein
MRWFAVLLSVLLQWNVKQKIAAASFVSQSSPQLISTTTTRHHHCNNPRKRITALGLNNDDKSDLLVEEARQLMAKAKIIRESLVSLSDNNKSTTTTQPLSKVISPLEGEGVLSDFTLPPHFVNNNGHRLYIDIGREPGTWMDSRWGASSRRLEFTLDISFLQRLHLPLDDDSTFSLQGVNDLALDDIATKLISSTTSSSRSSLSPIYTLHSARYARLLGGFDKMEIYDGGYCIESSSSTVSTMRFCLSVAGTTNGDITIPKGYIYFALPYFGTIITQQQKQQSGVEVENSNNISSTTASTQKRIMNLSSKDGTVTVKQMGWHTGWYREESRILGLFRAVPLLKAQNRYKI